MHRLPTIAGTWRARAGEIIAHRYNRIMQRLAVLNVVGLTRSLIGNHTPNIQAFADAGQLSSFKPAFPAVTCTAQSTYLTGLSPAEHGIVANGWYDRVDAEHKFWKQSNHLVRGEKLWESLRADHPDFTCAKMFWWYNMYSSADWSVTPRPMYPADGRKFFDVYTQPMDMREQVKADLGEFPFPTFWGPKADIPSSQWIAKSAMWVEEKHQPSLNLVYLPHLDYCLQKFGPGAAEIPAELEQIDRVVGELIDFYQARDIKVVILSEYGISKVDQPVYLNRLFREKGWITIKNELGRELMDCGASKVFAIADHQVAHIYLNDESLRDEVIQLLESTAGVEEVRSQQDAFGGDSRAGDLIAVAEANAWFAYYYWLDDAVAPDFARCIDIHRKPGYDPVELFIDPELKFPLGKIAKFLIKKKLGFRGLLDVIPLDATLVKGSHGRDNVDADEQPVYISQSAGVNVQSAEQVFECLKAEILAS